MGPRRFGPGPDGPGPPPDIREHLEEACKAAAPGRVDQLRFERRHDTMIVVVEGVTDVVAAFTTRWVPKRPDDTGFGWSARIVAMTALTLAMVAVMVDAMIALRRGATDLETTLGRLETDLRAEVPVPRAREFGLIAARLGAMASHLADARERERALERRLSHEARLAALGRLVAGVAHEIRNPLTGIKLLLDGIARRPVDRRTAGDVEVCLGEIARLDHVVTSLLGVARDARLAPVAMPLGPLVDERIAFARELAASRRVAVRGTGDGELFAERDVVVRVLDNLIRNAIEASPLGGEVRVEATAQGEQASLAVIDDGDGIPAERASELFEPFFTLKPTGTGLGLWLSRSLVEARGGSLQYAREGRQTRFTLSLPTAPRASTLLPATALPSDTSLPTP